MKKTIVIGLLVLTLLGIVTVVNAQIVPPSKPGQELNLDPDEARDWKNHGVEPVAAISQPEISQERAIGIARGFAPGLDKATDIKARFVKINKGTAFDGDRWIITFKGVQIPAVGGHPDGVDNNSQWYFDAYYVVVDSKDGKAIAGFSGPGKQKN